MIAWYSRARSWFNNSISSERDILNTSRSRFIFQKRFSSGLSAGIDVIFGLTFRFFMCAAGVTLTVPIASGIKLFKKAQPGTFTACANIAPMARRASLKRRFPKYRKTCWRRLIDTTRPRVNFFLNKFRKLGLNRIQRRDPRQQLALERCPARVNQCSRSTRRQMEGACVSVTSNSKTRGRKILEGGT